MSNIFVIRSSTLQTTYFVLKDTSTNNVCFHIRRQKMFYNRVYSLDSLDAIHFTQICVPIDKNSWFWQNIQSNLPNSPLWSVFVAPTYFNFWERNALKFLLPCQLQLTSQQQTIWLIHIPYVHAKLIRKLTTRLYFYRQLFYSYLVILYAS